MYAVGCILDLVLSLRGCFAILAVAQEKSDAASIRGLASKRRDAQKHRQIAAPSSLRAEDFVITVEDGSTYGKVGFISYNCAWT